MVKFEKKKNEKQRLTCITGAQHACSKTNVWTAFGISSEPEM